MKNPNHRELPINFNTLKHN